MSVIIRLQNLPLAAGSSDIRQFFGSLQIPGGGVHILGGKYGDAFIAFVSETEGRLALKLSGRQICRETVCLYPSSAQEMNLVISGTYVKPTEVPLIDDSPASPISSPVMEPFASKQYPPSHAPSMPMYNPDPSYKESLNYGYSYSTNSNDDVESYKRNADNANKGDPRNLDNIKQSMIVNESKKPRLDPRVRVKEPPTEYNVSPSKQTLQSKGLNLLNGIINSANKQPFQSNQPIVNNNNPQIINNLRNPPPIIMNSNVSKNLSFDNNIKSELNAAKLSLSNPSMDNINQNKFTNLLENTDTIKNINKGKVLLGDKPIDVRMPPPIVDGNNAGQFPPMFPNGRFPGPMNRFGGPMGMFNGPRGRGRGRFEGPMGRGRFEGPMGRGEGQRGRGGFEGHRGRGGFEGQRGRGGFEGHRGRGDFEGRRGRGDFEGRRGRGHFEGHRGRGGFEGQHEGTDNSFDRGIFDEQCEIDEFERSNNRGGFEGNFRGMDYNPRFRGFNHRGDKGMRGSRGPFGRGNFRGDFANGPMYNNAQFEDYMGEMYNRDGNFNNNNDRFPFDNDNPNNFEQEQRERKLDSEMSLALEECKNEVLNEQSHIPEDPTCIYMYNLPERVTYHDIRKFLGEDCPIINDGLVRLKIINNDQGKRIGDAYVFFHKSFIAVKALKLNKKTMGGKPVYIRICPKKEYDNKEDSAIHKNIIFERANQQFDRNNEKLRDRDGERFDRNYDNKNKNTYEQDRTRSYTPRSEHRTVDRDRRVKELPAPTINEDKTISNYLIYIRGLPLGSTMSSLKSFLGDVRIITRRSFVYESRDQTISALVELSSKRDLTDALRLHKTVFKKSECVSVYVLTPEEYLKKKEDIRGKEILDKQVDIFCIRLSNLDDKTDINKIKEFLGNEIQINGNGLHNMKCDGIAYVSLKSKVDLDRAVKLNGEILDGQIIDIEIVKEIPSDDTKVKNMDLSLTLKNLPYSLSREEIESQFIDYNPVPDSVCIVINQRTGQPSGEATIDFLNENSRRSAKIRMHNVTLKGRTLKIS